MKALVTGSSGHLGEALVRTLQGEHEVVGLDRLPSPYTTVAGSIRDRQTVAECMREVDVVFHTATLHKPHVATHCRQDFIDTNVTGTLNLLEHAVSAGVGAFIFTSTTSAFGSALRPPPNTPAAWITEERRGLPKNIYGATKVAAEELCALFHVDCRLPCLVLRTSRFFPEVDDDPSMCEEYADLNLKCNEFLHRRVDIADAVTAHLLAAERAAEIGFAKYIISATTPFCREDVAELRVDAPSVVERRVPGFQRVYEDRGWKMFPQIDRVYSNERARIELGWNPVFDFAHVLGRLRRGLDLRGDLALSVGAKGYHRERPAEVKDSRDAEL